MESKKGRIETDIVTTGKEAKAYRKKKVSKLRHELERVYLKDFELPVIEGVIEQLWTALEKVQETLEELTAFYIEVGDESGKNEAIVIEESETIEKKVQRVIEAEHANCNKNSRTQNRKYQQAD